MFSYSTDKLWPQRVGRADHAARPATGVERAGAADAGHQRQHGDALRLRCAGEANPQGDVRAAHGPYGAEPDGLCVGGGQAVAGERAAAGLADISVRCGTAVHAGGERDGAGRKQAGVVLPHGCDGHAAGGDGGRWNAGVGGVYQGVWRECGGHQQQRGVLSPAAAAAGAVF